MAVFRSILKVCKVRSGTFDCDLVFLTFRVLLVFKCLDVLIVILSSEKIPNLLLFKSLEVHGSVS